MNVFPLLTPFTLLVTSQAQQPVVIGAHYTDALAGLAVYRNAKESVLLNIAWVGTDGKTRQGYNALSDARLRFGEAAPDDSYHRISWEVGPSTVTYEWGLAGKGAAVGQITATGTVEIRLSMGAAWPGSNPELVANPKLVVEKAGGLIVSLNAIGRIMPWGGGLPGWSQRFLLDTNNPIHFSIGSGQVPNPNSAAASLATALRKYKGGRLWAEGDWGDFLSPLENELGNSKVYSMDTGRLAHIVSRRWCLPDGQVMFCWDSFFNGLLSCIEDPAGAKKTVRAVLNGVTPEGFVPNFSGRGWGTSFDRSQPCVGSMCVWKINQRQPDVAFLKDVYPKLLRWHRWWFPKRDGNHDGLLEWGTATGDLQNAKYESGLDDSPMFDDGTMSGPNMTLDSTDLSSLWAMDADYLARIADAIGKPQDAKALRKDRSDMARRIDEKLWNDAMNAYCYRYWTPKQPSESVDPHSVLSANGRPGLRGEYFVGRELQGKPIVRQDPIIDFNWKDGPIRGIGENNFSARWTGEFTPPRNNDAYVFRVTSDDGARMWVDGKQVIDAWTIHGATTYESKPMRFDPSSTHQMRLEYFQAEGGAEIHLAIQRILLGEPGQVFSKRLSPLNYYPLIVDAASKSRARKTLDIFFQPTKFGGPQVCPTISRDDPAFPAQGYWRGTVWGPTSYLTFLGVRKYATDAESSDYAEKSVRLFMQNWIGEGTCRENFNIVGKSSSDPHYTWGALMCLLGLEELCDLDPDGRLRLNGNSGKHIKVHNLRLAGRLFDLTVEPHRAVLMEHRKVVAQATGKVARLKL